MISTITDSFSHAVDRIAESLKPDGNPVSLKTHAVAGVALAVIAAYNLPLALKFGGSYLVWAGICNYAEPIHEDAP